MPQRLRPLFLALMTENISFSELAKRVKIARQSMSTRFAVDDCKLSDAEKMADAIGYEFSYTLRKKPSTEDKPNTRKIPFSPSIPTGNRLRPFSIALLDAGVTFSELSRRVRIARQSMSTRFAVDDCKLSDAEKMADAIGYEFICMVTKKEQQAVSPAKETE